jgi:hypothetical protein
VKPLPNLTSSQEAELVELVRQFGASFLLAQKDWATFKAGVAAGLFSTSQRDTVTAWFKDFPQFWDTLKLNFQDPQWISGGITTATRPGTLSVRDTDFSLKVDIWVSKLRAQTSPGGLGIIPVFIVIAGIIIAGLLGAGAALWALGYYKKQDGVHDLIEGVVAGKLPATVLDLPILRDLVSDRKK